MTPYAKCPMSMAMTAMTGCGVLVENKPLPIIGITNVCDRKPKNCSPDQPFQPPLIAKQRIEQVDIDDWQNDRPIDKMPKHPEQPFAAHRCGVTPASTEPSISGHVRLRHRSSTAQHILRRVITRVAMNPPRIKQGHIGSVHGSLLRNLLPPSPAMRNVVSI